MTGNIVPGDAKGDNVDRPTGPPSSTLSSPNGTGEKHAAAAPSVSPPPNGGLNAWLQVVGSFFFYFNSWYALSPTGYISFYAASVCKAFLLDILC